MPIKIHEGANRTGPFEMVTVVFIYPGRKRGLAQQDQLLCPFLGVNTLSLEGQPEYSDPGRGHQGECPPVPNFLGDRGLLCRQVGPV